VNDIECFLVNESIEVPGEKGCFAGRCWSKGEILEFISPQKAQPNLMHINLYLPFSENENAKYGYRYKGDMVHFSSDKRIITDYINHSNNPNVVIYRGYTIALCDIEQGQEILADYRFLMHEKFTMDCGSYAVTGFPAHEAESLFWQCVDELGITIDDEISPDLQHNIF
jgi:hypothetical protein